MSQENIIEKNQIDAVITWVNGDDPNHQQKLQAALGNKIRKSIPGAEKTRFATADELKYSVISILKFAPFIRKIFIVTDDQNPGLTDFLEKHFPERASDVLIVDHKEIFQGFEQYLPTFNSRSIEALLWRINGLSENYLYLNDDTFIIRNLNPSELTLNGIPVLRGKWLFKPILRMALNQILTFTHKYILKSNHYEPKPSYHLGQWTAASLLKYKFRYFFSSHIPRVFNKTKAESFFKENPQILEHQISYKFRHFAQFNCASLFYHLEIKSGNKNFAKPSFAFLHPHGRHKGYIDKKLKMCEKNSDLIFMNIQSLELCDKDDQEKIFNWLNKIMGI
jgi:hypothetical protein